MATILVATWDGAGNFPPQRALVRTLIDRGHSVCVLAHDNQRADVETDGAHFLPYVGAAPFDSAAPGSDAIVFDAVVFAPAIGVSLSAEITRLKPDVLLVDTMLAAALAAAQASGGHAAEGARRGVRPRVDLQLPSLRTGRGYATACRPCRTVAAT